MRRREFITLIGGAAAWPLAARAQQATKVPTIGYLGASTAATESAWTSAFVQRLRDLGWIEGRNVAIKYRWGEGLGERFAEIAAEFVSLKVERHCRAGRRRYRCQEGDIAHSDGLSVGGRSDRRPTRQ
jgi:putative ABC transport system substrate-binding protein